MAELAECFVIQLAVEGSILLYGGLGLRLDRDEALQSCKTDLYIQRISATVPYKCQLNAAVTALCAATRRCDHLFSQTKSREL